MDRQLQMVFPAMGGGGGGGGKGRSGVTRLGVEGAYRFRVYRA